MSMWVPNSESGPKIQSLEGENEIPQIGIIIQKLQCSLVNCLRLGQKAVKIKNRQKNPNPYLGDFIFTFQ